MTGRARKNLLWASAASVAAMLTFAAFALAMDRDGYTAAVEPICKKNKKTSDRILKPVKRLVKKNKLKQASRAFAKAAKALQKAQKQLASVEKPPADSARLNKWLREIKGEVSLMKTISRKFKQGNKGKATSLAVRLQKNADKANQNVIVFEFNYCKIDPSQYT